MELHLTLQFPFNNNFMNTPVQSVQGWLPIQYLAAQAWHFSKLLYSLTWTCLTSQFIPIFTSLKPLSLFSTSHYLSTKQKNTFVPIQGSPRGAAWCPKFEGWKVLVTILLFKFQVMTRTGCLLQYCRYFQNFSPFLATDSLIAFLHRARVVDAHNLIIITSGGGSS